MEDSQEYSIFSELINKSYIYIDYKENWSQQHNFTSSQYDENKSEKFYSDFIEQNRQTKVDKEINSSDEENFEASGLSREIDSENETEPIKKYSNVHFFCKQCHQVPMIKFIDDLNINCTCACYKNEQRNITKFLDDTLLNVCKEDKNNILLVFFLVKYIKVINFYIIVKLVIVHYVVNDYQKKKIIKSIPSKFLIY
jgi:magnesium-transporting ATPase (P-type)